ncbi:methionyl-tRNA formyltransferase [Fundicoccus culcitae]|uniref:Methionyl-tRNA formyltransferase n=1 Tax=Fundicoccus culcitae TaxID=2969821 RepID=A0ABY5P6S7_9LACT|nr:methionyl-tRNA formyltransferase [Fundicoccus culcitae]UUX34080.1 methionyl-tRNA formyltransferase [Fundicoccus culcitae]
MTTIIFMGTAAFSATVLQRLIDENYHIEAVVSQPDRPVGRKRVLQPTAVKQVALDNHIAVYQPEKLNQSAEMAELLTKEVDFIVTAAYGQYIPKQLLKLPKYYAVNVHASLLPKYRGAAPIQYAIWKGENETGVSIMEMVAEMDAGGVFAQQSVTIDSQDDAGDLFNKLAVIGSNLLIEVLPLIINENKQPQPQDEDLVTYAPMLKREEEQIDWSLEAKDIDQHVRAFRPNPSTYSWVNNQRVKIWAGFPIDWTDKSRADIGEILAMTDNYLVIQAGNNTYFAITEWQESGKRRMLIKQAYNGLNTNEWVGQKFYWK